MKSHLWHGAAGDGHITGNGSVELQSVRGMVKIPVRR